MLCLPKCFGKGEIVAAVRCRLNLSPFFTGRGVWDESTSRTKFQALETGGDVDSDLALEAERL